MPALILKWLNFELDAEASRLTRDGETTVLSPRDCRLLYVLVEHQGRLLSHNELLAAAWGPINVGPDVLKVRIARLRRLLGDNAAAPTFIASVHGEGYKFLPAVERRERSPLAGDGDSPFVGRAAPMEALREALARATAGRRQVVFISGEAGIGKTTLIERFASRHAGHLWFGRGQCIEHRGEGEPFLPLLEAIGQLARHASRERVRAALLSRAPSWLLHLPALTAPAEREALQRQLVARSRERMLRELVDALDGLAEPVEGTLASPLPIVLVLEDLQWSDVSTLDFLGMLARRSEPARVLVLATCRNEVVDAHAPAQEAVNDLLSQRAASKVELGPLIRPDVGDYVRAQFGVSDDAEPFVELLHRRTSGHPLLIADVVRELRLQRLIVEKDGRWLVDGSLQAVAAMIPVSLQQLVDRQRDTLSPEDEMLLQAASIAGSEFPAAVVAAALEQDDVDVETRLLELARAQRFLTVIGDVTWPDGTRWSQFAFRHALVQEVWERQVGQRQRQQWNLRIAQREEAAFDAATHGVAADLALRFEAGGNPRRAIAYRQLASRIAVQRAANAEARLHIDHALTLLPLVADPTARLQTELDLQIARGSLLVMSEGFGSGAGVAAFQRAYQLCAGSNAPTLVDSAFGLCRFFWSRGEFAKAREMGEQMRGLIGAGVDPVREIAANTALGTVLMHQGELSLAVERLSEAAARSRSDWREEMIGVYASDLRAVSIATLSNSLFVLGRLDESHALRAETEAIASDASHPTSTAAALFGLVIGYYFEGLTAQVRDNARRLREIAVTHEIIEYVSISSIFTGWSLLADGDAAGESMVRAGSDIHRLAGMQVFQPMNHALLADGLLRMGKRAEARDAADNAIDASTRLGRGFYDAEVWRIDGDLQQDAAAAENSYLKARAIAQQQGARSFDLRAALALGRLMDRHGRGDDGRRLVAAASAGFTGQNASPDLALARLFAASEAQL